MFINQINKAKESTYLINIALYSLPFSDLINKANKCNLILGSIQLNHFNETTWINTSTPPNSNSSARGDVLPWSNSVAASNTQIPQSWSFQQKYIKLLSQTH
jgi:hypothetical protein